MYTMCYIIFVQRFSCRADSLELSIIIIMMIIIIIYWCVCYYLLVMVVVMVVILLLSALGSYLDFVA